MTPINLADRVWLTLGDRWQPLTRYQADTLRLASAGGEVPRGDLMARCGISSDWARRTLASLVERGLLRRLGSGPGAWYVPRGADEAGR